LMRKCHWICDAQDRREAHFEALISTLMQPCRAGSYNNTNLVKVA
jgi:hypothetical protein